jgi:hypothetical protein
MKEVSLSEVWEGFLIYRRQLGIALGEPRWDLPKDIPYNLYKNNFQKYWHHEKS